MESKEGKEREQKHSPSNSTSVSANAASLPHPVHQDVSAMQPTPPSAGFQSPATQISTSLPVLSGSDAATSETASSSLVQPQPQLLDPSLEQILDEEIANFEIREYIESTRQ